MWHESLYFSVNAVQCWPCTPTLATYCAENHTWWWWQVWVLSLELFVYEFKFQISNSRFVVPNFGIRGVVYTMDHGIVPRPCKLCDWLLNSSWDHFGLHQEFFFKVNMKFEVPKTCILNAYIIHRHGPTAFAVGEAKEVLWQKKARVHGKEKFCYNIFWWNLLWRREYEDNKRQENGRRWPFFFFSKIPFLGVY